MATSGAPIREIAVAVAFRGGGLRGLEFSGSRYSCSSRTLA